MGDSNTLTLLHYIRHTMFVDHIVMIILSDQNDGDDKVAFKLGCHAIGQMSGVLAIACIL